MRTNRFFLLVLSSLALALFSCDKGNSDPDPDPDPDPGTVNPNKYVNDWIYENMSIYYLWNTNIPKSPNYTLAPSDFFTSLLYKYKQLDGDRFSWIQENYVDLLNSLSGVASYDIGFEYVGFRMSSSSNDILGCIAYVKPGTPAYTMGLKRGDLFAKVNGTQLTTSNWRSVFSDANAAEIAFVEVNASNQLVSKAVKSVTKAPNYAENPVFLDSVYIEGGHKIGYLVYNFFATDGGTDDYAYDRGLNKAFAKFKAEGVTDLVLDFRYNSGGAMSSAVLLGSMIVPNLNTSNVFTKLQYNSFVQNEFVSQYGSDALLYKFQNVVRTGQSTTEPLNNIGGTVQNLVVLTGNWTASASEMVINGLRPYMSGKVSLIGVTTAGKNVGSISIYEKNDSKNKWGMQPIVLKYSNKDGYSDFESGFVPDIEERDNDIDNMLPLGDRDEVMLKIAMQKITGTYSGSSVTTMLHGASARAQVVGSSVEQKAWTNTAIVDDERLKSLKLK